MKQTMISLLAGALSLAAMPALAVTDADRLAVYKEFRVQYDSRQYAAARPLAEKLVKLTEEQYGPDELVLTKPLTNLATVDYKLGNYPNAIENYQRTLRILQAKFPPGQPGPVDLLVPQEIAIGDNFALLGSNQAQSVDLVGRSRDDKLALIRITLLQDPFTEMATEAIPRLRKDAKDTAIVVAYEKESVFGVSDASLAIHSMMLTAWAEGVGSNWVGFSGRYGETIAPLLGIPNEYEILAVVPFGYPVATLGKGIKKRKALAEVASSERFGQPFA